MSIEKVIELAFEQGAMGKVTAETDLVEDQDFDELDLLEFAILLDEEFEITIDGAEVDRWVYGDVVLTPRYVWETVVKPNL